MEIKTLLSNSYQTKFFVSLSKKILTEDNNQTVTISKNISWRISHYVQIIQKCLFRLMFLRIWTNTENYEQFLYSENITKSEIFLYVSRRQRIPVNLLIHSGYQKMQNRNNSLPVHQPVNFTKTTTKTTTSKALQTGAYNSLESISVDLYQVINRNALRTQ